MWNIIEKAMKNRKPKTDKRLKMALDALRIYSDRSKWNSTQFVHVSGATVFCGTALAKRVLSEIEKTNG